MLKPSDLIQYTYLDGTIVTGRVVRPFGEKDWFLVDVDGGGREHLYGGQMCLLHADYDPKPIPLRQFDWTVVTDDYDGAEDSSNRGQIGYGRTLPEAIADLRRQLADEAA